MMDSHLICHSDGGGFYVPIDFPEPLYDEPDGELGGGILGSSQAALRELLQVAPLIGIQMENKLLPDSTAEEINNEESGPYLIERKVWLKLFERFRLSVQHRTLVAFG
jgi:hypothetical protein